MCDDGLDSVERAAASARTLEDSGVRVRAAHEGDLEHPGQAHVVEVPGPPAQELRDPPPAGGCGPHIGRPAHERSSRSRRAASLHRGDDARVPRAAADVAGQVLADLGLGRRRKSPRAAPASRAACPACRSRTGARAAWNACWIGCSSPPRASPSTVSISIPRPARPACRQESASRPSSLTVQAPQPPCSHATCTPVRPELVAEEVGEQEPRLGEAGPRSPSTRDCHLAGLSHCRPCLLDARAGRATSLRDAGRPRRRGRRSTGSSSLVASSADLGCGVLRRPAPAPPRAPAPARRRRRTGRRRRDRAARSPPARAKSPWRRESSAKPNGREPRCGRIDVGQQLVRPRAPS